MSKLPDAFPSAWENDRWSKSARSPKDDSASAPSVLDDSSSGPSPAAAPTPAPPTPAPPTSAPPPPATPFVPSSETGFSTTSRTEVTRGRVPLQPASPPPPAAQRSPLEDIAAQKDAAAAGNVGGQDFVLGIYDGSDPRCYILNENMYTLGRDRANTIPLPNRFVSRRHAYLLKVPTASSGHTYCLVDGNRKGGASTNGIMVNGERIATHYLQTGDIIYFGPEVRCYFLSVATVTVRTTPTIG